MTAPTHGLPNQPTQGNEPELVRRELTAFDRSTIGSAWQDSDEDAEEPDIWERLLR